MSTGKLQNFTDAYARKYKYLGADDSLTPVSNFSNFSSNAADGGCGGAQAADHQKQLRDTLVDELNALASSACDVPCDEDRELDEMMEKYEAHSTKAKPGGSGGSGGGKGSTCATFKDDPTIKLLVAKKEQLESFSFAYLHGECEGAHRCNPHAQVIRPALIACSGLLDGSVLFHDEALAEIGREIAGAQQVRTLSPAANGFAASLFQTDTIVPGVKKTSGEATYWVNVCHPVLHGQGVPAGQGRALAVKWVPANPLEVAKFQTLRHIEVTIRKHKQRILQVNHQVFALQRRLRNARAQSAQAYFTGPRRAVDSSAYGTDMEMFVGETAGRLRNKLRMRNTDEVPTFVPPAGFGQGALRKAKLAQAAAQADAEAKEDAAIGPTKSPKKSRSGR